MGYLDHSTNNIILDAVLTDYGRSKLAASGPRSAFSITKFAFGDDEIDYTIVKKYGRTVGKEKIEKNTPIFEALTNESIALKNKLIGLSFNGSNLQTVVLPVIQVSTSVSNLTPTSPSGEWSISLRYKNKTADNVDLSRDFGASGTTKKYAITMPDRFLRLTGAGVSPVTPRSDAGRTATYEYSVSNNSFNITLTAPTIDNSTLQIYGKKSGSSYTITSYVTIESLEIPAISKTFSVTYTSSI